ncbi:small protein [Caulobacter vibrioides]|nr:small protein [Caulobacter vibrioides]
MTPNSHTPLFSTEAFAALGAPDLVYVRPIKAAEILADAPEGVEDFDLSPDQTLYAVCRADGARLAVLTDHDAAVAAALAHELAPVSVH